jgi:hypothetical protein
MQPGGYNLKMPDIVFGWWGEGKDDSFNHPTFRLAQSAGGIGRGQKAERLIRCGSKSFAGQPLGSESSQTNFCRVCKRLSFALIRS